jgi:hypothetical protein
MYLATQCSDVQWPTNWSKWAKDNNKIHAKYPFITWNNAWYNAPCINWGTKAGKPVKINGGATPPILLIGETKDAATPFTGSLQVRSLFPRSVLIEGVGGTTHSGSLSGVACTDNTIAAYLDTGALPNRVSGNRSDKKCDPVPQPNPTEVAALSKAGTSRADLQKLIGIR